MKGGLLPIGSVVLLEESEKRLMIIGFGQAKPENIDRIYDYCGCLYPEGYMSADEVYLFDQEQIETIYSVGYMDQEQFDVVEQIEDAIRAYREAHGQAVDDEDFDDEDDDEEVDDEE